MAKQRIPLFDLKLSRRTISLVSQTLESGWLSTGPKAATLEQAISKYAGVRYAVAVGSATSGLYLALRALNATGREVVTSPFTFIATVEAIIRAGATPIFADIDPDSFTIDPDEVMRKTSERTACIMPVDIAGYPSDYTRLRKISAAHKVPIVADASHSLGAAFRGKSVPAQVDAAVFSFHVTKNLTCGEGGMVVSKFKPFADKVRLLSRHAMSSNAYERQHQEQWEYDVTDVGYKGNMSDVLASIGLGQFAEFEKNQQKRKRIAERYLANLDDLSELAALPRVPRGVRHAWHLFIVRLHLSRLNITRDEFIGEMSRRGVECGVHYRPVFEMSFYKEHGLTEQMFPNSAYAGRRVVSLPMYPTLTFKQVDQICGVISDILKKNKR